MGPLRPPPAPPFGSLCKIIPLPLVLLHVTLMSPGLGLVFASLSWALGVPVQSETSFFCSFIILLLLFSTSFFSPHFSVLGTPIWQILDFLDLLIFLIFLPTSCFFIFTLLIFIQGSLLIFVLGLFSTIFLILKSCFSFSILCCDIFLFFLRIFIINFFIRCFLHSLFPSSSQYVFLFLCFDSYLSILQAFLG